MTVRKSRCGYHHGGELESQSIKAFKLKRGKGWFVLHTFEIRCKKTSHASLQFEKYLLKVQ